MVGMIDDGAHAARLLRVAAVHLDPDRDAKIRRRLRALPQRQCDLLQGFPLGDSRLGLQTVGAYFDAGTAEVGGEPRVGDGAVDIPAHDRRIGVVELERTAEPGDFHAGIRECLPQLRARDRAQLQLHAMRVGSPQLDAGESGRDAHPDERGNVPLRTDLIGHESKFHCSASQRP